jgi:uncharacterized protein (TIGR03083 family)
MSTDLATYVAALEQTWGGVVSACTNLSPAQWDLPTELPGWSVKDNVSHVVGVELILLGEPDHDHDVPDLPHLRHDVGKFMEAPVHARRSVAGAAVLEEFRKVTARRLEAVRGCTDANLDDEVVGIFGPTKLRHLLGLRVFDSWAHEQDVRRALGHPGGQSNDAARISLQRLLRGLSRLAEDLPAASGKTVVVETTGALPSVSTLRLGESPSFAPGAADAPDVGIVTDFDTLLRLGTGRVTYDAVSSSVSLSGDVDLGAELARNFAVTP